MYHFSTDRPTLKKNSTRPLNNKSTWSRLIHDFSCPFNSKQRWRIYVASVVVVVVVVVVAATAWLGVQQNLGLVRPVWDCIIQARPICPCAHGRRYQVNFFSLLHRVAPIHIGDRYCVTWKPGRIVAVQSHKYPFRKGRGTDSGCEQIRGEGWGRGSLEYSGHPLGGGIALSLSRRWVFSQGES